MLHYTENWTEVFNKIAYWELKAKFLVRYFDMMVEFKAAFLQTIIIYNDGSSDTSSYLVGYETIAWSQLMLVS